MTIKNTLYQVCLVLAALAPTAAFAIPGSDAVGARIIPLSDDAYAGSSVNVVAGTRQTLYTDSVYQYAGFYDAQARLVLAKRRLGEDQWQMNVTEHRAQVEDAHNTVSLVVDGKGFLHVAWGHHNTPLSYAVAREAGGLELAESRPMLGKQEQSVSYPQFFRLSGGDLLFLYRDGGSGDGKVVLNHYDSASGKWSRRQDNLIDGESQRSAYWDMTVDAKGVLHLAWNWRETPDVATNHDLAYARSRDQGKTWQTSTGRQYQLPITADKAEIAAVIEQNHNLMNPPTVGSDRHGQPYIASYWSAEPDGRPRFHVVYRNEAGWRTLPGPKAGVDFKLQGGGTKRPPISRAALAVESDGDQTSVHLIYRDDHRNGRVVAASLANIAGADAADPVWSYRYLTEHHVGAWEPSLDPMQWQRLKHAQMLVQTVEQVDGDDKSGSGAEPSEIGVLLWSPVWERHQE